MKVNDPVVEEVRAIREALAKEYGYDVAKLGRALQVDEATGDRKVVHLSPRPVVSTRKAS